MIQVSKRFLILCEDEKSSLLYLDSFKKDEKLRRDLAAVSIEIYQLHDISPLGLVSEAKRKKKIAKKERNPFDEVWVVLDKDGHANLPQAINKAESNDIKVALSIICFEYWVLLHFEKTTRQFARCDDVVAYLKQKHYCNYSKKCNCYEDIKDRTEDAINNGKWLAMQVQNDLDRGIKYYELGAYTNMHKLVKKLYNPKKHLFS